MISQWQILEAAVNGAKSLDDKAIAGFLKKNTVDTIYGTLRFDGPFNHGTAEQLIKQVQGGEWKVVWPTKEEVRRYSIIVLITVILFTAFVALLDYFFGSATLWLYDR